MKRVNVARIGYKFVGRAHSNAWRPAASFFGPRPAPVLKVICGRDETGVRDVAARFGWQEHATDWEEVVRRGDIDVVDICPPGDTHLPIALAAAEAGKVILCEKPLANNVADAERIVGAVRSRGVIHMLCHNYRRVPAVALAKRLIEEGHIGEGRQPKPDFEDGVRTQKIPDAVERAALSRRWESVEGNGGDGGSL